eukprot:scaffold31366_cov36-Phaeocystis_antarctica.AAC.1
MAPRAVRRVVWVPSRATFSTSKRSAARLEPRHIPAQSQSPGSGAHTVRESYFPQPHEERSRYQHVEP